jgi:membrane protein DedA with SNARE-associated domain
MVNIASGLSNMNHKKFITAIIIGKIFLVYFWGFVGTSLIESLKNPKILIELGLFMLLAFIISKLVNKKYKLE